MAGERAPQEIRRTRRAPRRIAVRLHRANACGTPLDFIPGSIEWADFDPTATANAIYLLDVPHGLNRAALERTFERYLTDWRNKRSGKVHGV